MAVALQHRVLLLMAFKHTTEEGARAEKTGKPWNRGEPDSQNVWDRALGPNDHDCLSSNVLANSGSAGDGFD